MNKLIYLVLPLLLTLGKADIRNPDSRIETIILRVNESSPGHKELVFDNNHAIVDPMYPTLIIDTLNQRFKNNQISFMGDLPYEKTFAVTPENLKGYEKSR